jgi:hypothetical protein
MEQVMISKIVQDFGWRKEKMKFDTEEENDEQDNCYSY